MPISSVCQLLAGSYYMPRFNAGERSRDDGRASRYCRSVEATPRRGSNSPAGRSLRRPTVDESVSSVTHRRRIHWSGHYRWRHWAPSQNVLRSSLEVPQCRRSFWADRRRRLRPHHAANYRCKQNVFLRFYPLIKNALLTQLNSTLLLNRLEAQRRKTKQNKKRAERQSHVEIITPFR